MHQQRQFDLMTDDEVSGARRVLDSAQDVAARAGSYVQARVARLADRAQDLAQDAGDRLAQGGHAASRWVASTREVVKSHPLQALAATIGAGYVAGKLLFRRR